MDKYCSDSVWSQGTSSPPMVVFKKSVLYLDDRCTVYVGVYLLGGSSHVGDGVEVIHL